MYFSSRTEAGKRLAAELAHYRYKDSAVLSLTEGGVIVGAQIAAVLHCPLMFLLTKDILLPGEKSALGVVDQNGHFTYNDLFSTGELDWLTTENRGLIEQLKMQRWHELNRVLSDGGIVEPELLRERNIVIVSDGFINGTSLLATYTFLKSINVKNTIIATPYASVEAVDKMHLLADELHVLSVIDGVFEIDHYFEDNNIPSQEEIIKILNQAILHWK